MNNKYFLLILLLLFAGSTMSQNKIDNSKANDLFKELLKESKIVGGITGYSIDGQLVWQTAEGYANEKSKIPFNKNTITRTGSIAKCITGVAVLQLVEQGQIDLNETIQTYVPSYPIHPEGDITIKHLLSHMSGIGGYESAKETESKKEYATLNEATHIFKDRKLKFTPGSSYNYTTYGYVVLGRVIEEVTGMTYEAYVKKHIFDVAGMNNSGVEHFDVEYDNKSKLYHKQRRKAKEAKKNNLSNRIPGGGFYTTLEDMIKFGNSIINHSLIKKETYGLMVEKQFDRGEGNNPYGFGWFLYGGLVKPASIIGHSGELTGASNQLFILPERKTVIVVLTNTSGTWKDVVQYGGVLIQIIHEGNYGKIK